MDVQVTESSPNHYMVAYVTPSSTDDVGYVTSLMTGQELSLFLTVDSIVERRDAKVDLSDTELTILKLAGRLWR